MKKTAVNKTLALFLSAALLFAGCGKTGGEQESVGDMAGDGDKNMGRYVEKWRNSPACGWYPSDF